MSRSAQLFEDQRARAASNQSFGWDILIHSDASRDDGAVADSDLTDNGHASTNPHVVLNNEALFTTAASEPRLYAFSKTMAASDDRAAGRDQHPLTDTHVSHNGSQCIDLRVSADVHAVLACVDVHVSADLCEASDSRFTRYRSERVTEVQRASSLGQRSEWDQ